MSSPIFSFVVPIYNVEKYLSNCIFSLMNQTFKDFEIILVDDGSTDNSGKIADHFSNIDYRIKVFHKKNGGLSDARNFGLSRASGEYVIFVDSDDWVSTHLLEYAKAEIAKSKADLIFFPYFDVNENMCIFRTNEKSFEKAGFLPSNKCLDFFLKNHLIFTAWQYVAKRSTFIKGQISFPVGRHYEDDATTYKVIYYSETVSFLKKPLYYYLHRNDSIMGKNKNGFTPVELYQLHLSFYEMCDFIKRNSLLSTYKYACEYYFSELSSAYFFTKFDNQKERKLLGKVKHSLIYFSFKCSFKGQITIKRKIKLVLFRLGLISYPRLLEKIIHRKEGCARS